MLRNTEKSPEALESQFAVPNRELSVSQSRPISISAVKKSDDILISECLDGRPDAFGELVIRYQDRLLNALTSMLGSSEDALDVTQDAFVQAFEKLGTFRGTAAFYSWLFRIALNCSVNQHRKKPRGQVSIDVSRQLAGSEPADSHPESHPTHLLERKERQALVQLALSELSFEYRTALVLKEMEGLKYEEIASIVNCPVGTVRSRIHRAREELRDKLRLLLGDESP